MEFNNWFQIVQSIRIERSYVIEDSYRCRSKTDVLQQEVAVGDSPDVEITTCLNWLCKPDSLI